MGPGFPFPGGFDFSQLMRMLQSQGPVNFDVARQVAGVIATSDPETGQPGVEPPIDRDAASVYDGLVRAAQTAVADTTGIAAVLTVPRAHGRPAGLVDRRRSTASRPCSKHSRARSAARPTGADAPDPTDAEAPARGEEALFSFLMQNLLPVLLGVWSGWMIGQLSHQALGQYDLPLPLEATPDAGVRRAQRRRLRGGVVAARRRAALRARPARDRARRAALRSRGCASSSAQLAKDYVGAYEMNPEALEEQLGGLDFTNPEAMQSLGGFGDAGALLGAMRSDRQGPLLEELQRFVSVLEGYADVVVETIGERMVSAHERIDEALRRHRLERGDAACVRRPPARTRARAPPLRGRRRVLPRRHRARRARRPQPAVGGPADGADPPRARSARTLARPHRAPHLD